MESFKCYTHIHTHTRHLRMGSAVQSLHFHVGPVPTAGSPCPSDLRCHIDGEENMIGPCLSISVSIKIGIRIVPIS